MHNTTTAMDTTFSEAYNTIDPAMESRFEARKNARKMRKMILMFIMLIVVTLALMGCEYIHRGYFAMGGEVFLPSAALAVWEFCKSI